MPRTPTAKPAKTRTKPAKRAKLIPAPESKSANRGANGGQPALPIFPIAEKHLDISTLERLSDVFDDESAAHITEFGDGATARKFIEVDHADALRTGRKPIVEWQCGQSTLDDDGLAALVEVVSRHRLELTNTVPDILGRAYEYLLRKFAEAAHFVKERPKNQLTDEGVAEVYRQWETREKLSRVITLDQTRAADYNLSPSQFVDVNDRAHQRPLAEITRDVNTARAGREMADAQLTQVLAQFGLDHQEHDA